MTEQIPLIDVAGYTVPEPPPRAKVIYLIAAYAKDRGWTIRRETAYHEYATQQAAVDAANKLSPMWTHKRILKVVLP